MEHFGDPHALYEWSPEKREDAMTYLYNREIRSGRLTAAKSSNPSADMGRLFGADFEGGS